MYMILYQGLRLFQSNGRTRIRSRDKGLLARSRPHGAPSRQNNALLVLIMVNYCLESVKRGNQRWLVLLPIVNGLHFPEDDLCEAPLFWGETNGRERERDRDAHPIRLLGPTERKPYHLYRGYFYYSVHTIRPHCAVAASILAHPLCPSGPQLFMPVDALRLIQLLQVPFLLLGEHLALGLHGLVDAVDAAEPDNGARHTLIDPRQRHV